MGSAALNQLEMLLSARKLDGTLARQEQPCPDAVRSTGIAVLDSALRGGWPRGALSELSGRASSGRTSVLIATLAAATARGELVGLVDTFDRFDPGTAAAAGLRLDRVLWVRGVAVGADPRHPLGARAVHQAIRALDLIVRAGGFAVAALDLIGASPRALRDLPPATWLRLARANEGQPTVCLLVGDGAMGRSARGVSVHLRAATRWTGSSPQSRRLAGLDLQARIERADRPAAADPSWTLRAAG
jgi:RecA/RadA recombinase